MAKKEATPNMVEQFAEFKELKNIDKTTMISVLEESFRNVLAKMFGTDENLDVILNPDKGDVQIFQNLLVVPDGEVTDPNMQISLSDAQADDDPDAEVLTPRGMACHPPPDAAFRRWKKTFRANDCFFRKYAYICTLKRFKYPFS